MSESRNDEADDGTRAARLVAQHELLLMPAIPPAALGGAFFLALPLAARADGFSVTILSTGIASVLLLLGLGLLSLAAAQGLRGQVRRRWRLELSRDRLSATETMVWIEALVGLAALGAAAGWLLAFLLT